MKTIAVIVSCDTKYKEACYIRQCLELSGVQALLVDISIGLQEPQGSAEMPRRTVLSEAGISWEEVCGQTKGELMELMTEAVRFCVLKLHHERKIDGVLAVGGVQNTTVATTAMQALPIGFPKVMATTIACGQKPFGSVVGDKDIVVIPSISDFTGLNPMTELIIANACACVAGMALYAGKELKKGARPLVGITLMGITNTGACAAVEELERAGIGAIGFHSTGVGGRIMEQLALDGILDGILDLTTHEITSEYFGGGFSFGGNNRLIAPLKQGVPFVACPGGLDFVDFAKHEFPPRMDQRLYNMHNGTLAHIKILPDEAKEIGAIFAGRLNQALDGVRLLLPTNGMRKNADKGGNLYAPETDKALLDSILDNIGENVQVQWIEGNLNEENWGKQAAHAIMDEMKRKGRIPC